ncbi:MAG: PAS domain-containing protein [Opitutales bacterium]|nr:PAS domain-containing protein [Opitutales bacterium]
MSKKQQQRPAQWESAYESLPIPVSLASEDGRIFRANAAWCALFGIDASSLPLDSMRQFLDDDYHNEDEMANRFVLNVGKSHCGEFWYALPDGKHCLLEVIRSLKIGEDGQVEGILMVFHDVSGFNWALEELKRSLTKTMEREQREGSTLIRLIQHFRDTLSAISAGSRLLEASPLSEEQNAWVSTVRSNAREMHDQMELMLRLNKLREHRTVEFTAFDVYDVITRVVERLKPLADEKCLNVVFEADPRIPVSVRSDSSLLKELIGLLLHNAIRFTDEGVVKLRAELLQETPRAYYISFSVSDTGCGIPEDELETIFRPYYCCNPSDPRSGYGLGLALAESICHALFSRLRVQSRLNEGSTFFFLLELAKDQS